MRDRLALRLSSFVCIFSLWFSSFLSTLSFINYPYRRRRWISPTSFNTRGKDVYVTHLFSKSWNLKKIRCFLSTNIHPGSIMQIFKWQILHENNPEKVVIIEPVDDRRKYIIHEMVLIPKGPLLTVDFYETNIVTFCDNRLDWFISLV